MRGGGERVAEGRWGIAGQVLKGAEREQLY